jgi:hypothetical protein
MTGRGDVLTAEYAPLRPSRARSRGAVPAMSSPVLMHRAGAAGKCSDSNDDTWFPPEPEPGADEGERFAYEDYAREACHGCPVTSECRELAVRIESRPGTEPHGIAGGLAPWQRETMIRARLAPEAVAS